MGPEAVVPVEDNADSFREHVPVADRAAVDEEPACGPLVRQPVAVLVQRRRARACRLSRSTATKITVARTIG
jgi:hypothetical protein